MSSPNRIVELSSIIAKETAKLDSFFTESGLPTPSLEPDALWSLPIPESATDLEESRVAVMEACTELNALLTGPKVLLRRDVSMSCPKKKELVLISFHSGVQTLA